MSATLGFTMTQYKKDNCPLFVKLFEFLYGTLKIYLDAIHQIYMGKPKKLYDIKISPLFSSFSKIKKRFLCLVLHFQQRDFISLTHL